MTDKAKLERVARAIEPVSAGDGVGALVLPLSNIIERGLQSILYPDAPTTEFAQQIINQIVKAAIAECNRCLPIDQAEQDGTKYLLWFRHRSGRLFARSVGQWDGEKWVHQGPGHLAPPTHFQYITPPEASGAKRRSDSDAE